MLHAGIRVTDDNFVFHLASMQVNRACTTVQLLHCSWLTLSWAIMASQQPRDEPQRLQDSGVIQYYKWELWVNKTKETKQWLALVWQLSKEMQISCFHVFPGRAEALITWGAKVKRFIIADFLSNISATNYQNQCIYIKVIPSQRWDILDTA